MAQTNSPGALRVRVLFFARYAEVVGTQAHDVLVPADATVADVLDAVREALPSAQAIPRRPLCARNAEQALPEDSVADGDEIAILPPLAGG